jgi:WD40 repeat protein
MNGLRISVWSRVLVFLSVLLLIILPACVRSSQDEPTVPAQITPEISNGPDAAGPAPTRPAPTDTSVPTDTVIPETQDELVINVDNAERLDVLSQVSEPGANSFVWLKNGWAFSIATDRHIAIYERFQTHQTDSSQMNSENPSKLTASDEGEMISWVDAENTVYLWDINFDEPSVLKMSQSPVTSLAFSTDGGKLAIASYDGGLEIWDTTDQVVSNSWEYPSWLSNISFSPDGATLAGVDAATFSIYFIDLAGGEIQQVLEWTESASPILYGAYMSPDWNWIAWVARGTVQLMERSGGNLGPTLNHEDFISSVSWSPDSALLATASAATVEGVFSPVVNVWDIENGVLTASLVQPDVSLSVAFSPNGIEMGTLGSDAVLYFWAVAK